MQLFENYDLGRKVCGSTLPVAPFHQVNFPILNVDWKKLTDIVQQNQLACVSLTSITNYFEERLAEASQKRGRILGLNKFASDVFVWVDSLDIFIRSKCCAEMRKKVQYDVKIHIHGSFINGTSCSCPAGLGWSAACKHVAAVLYILEHYAITGISGIITFSD